MRAGWALLGWAAAGCMQEEGLGRVDQGRIDLARWGQGRIDLQISSSDERCFAPSEDITASIDGFELALTQRGGWGYSVLYLEEYCTTTAFEGRVPLSEEAEVSTVVLEDGRHRFEFEVPHLRTRHEMRWVEPSDGLLDGGIPATFDVVPAHAQVALHREADLWFGYEGGLPDHTVCARREPGGWCDNTTLQADAETERVSFVTPAFCTSGSWTWRPPLLGVEVPRAGAFEVDVVLYPEDQQVEVSVGDAPACELSLDDLDYVSPGLTVAPGEVFVVSPPGPGGFFVDGMWIEDPQGLGAGLPVGAGVELVGVHEVYVDARGSEHQQIVLESLRQTGNLDPWLESSSAVSPGELGPEWEGRVVHLVHPQVDLVDGEGFVADGVRVGSWWVAPSSVREGEQLEYLTGIWHHDPSLGDVLLPRSERDIDR